VEVAWSELEPGPDAELEPASHPIAVSWRGADYMAYLELDTPEEDDTKELIIVEPPSQLFIQNRRRRPAHPAEGDVSGTSERSHVAAGSGAPAAGDSAAKQRAAGPPSRAGRRNLLLAMLLVILAALVWYFLLRDPDPASAVSITRVGAVVMAAALTW
jgi:hypothetical protein